MKVKLLVVLFRCLGDVFFKVIGTGNDMPNTLKQLIAHMR